MRTSILSIAAFMLISGSAIVACNGGAGNKVTTAIDTTQRVPRGEYLVTIMGCDDCHSPKKMGAHGPEIIPELRLSGYPASRPIQKPDSNIVKQGWGLFGPDLTNAVGPWGMSFAGNITSDESGIGNWTEEQFITCLRKGKFKGLENSRDLLPPMPWISYKNLTDEDIKSVYAYLKTVKPVKNIVPAPIQLSDLK